MNDIKAICARCGQPIPEEKELFQLILPAGLSNEVMLEAISRAEDWLSENKPTEDESNAYKILAALISFPNEDNLVLSVGRALKELGAYVLPFHPKCAEEVKDVPPVYYTEGWG